MHVIVIVNHCTSSYIRRIVLYVYLVISTLPMEDCRLAVESSCLNKFYDQRTFSEIYILVISRAVARTLIGGGGRYSYIHVLPDRFLFRLRNLNLI